MEPGDLPVFQLLDPLGRFEDPITEGNVKVGHSPVVLNLPIRGLFKYVFVMFDVVMKSADLLVKAANFAGFLGVASGDGCEEPFCDGSEDVGVEVRVGCQCGCHGTG